MLVDCMRTTSKQALLSIILVEILVVGLFLHTKTNYLDHSPHGDHYKSISRGSAGKSSAGNQKTDLTLETPSSDPITYRWIRTENASKSNMTTVAVGCAITSHKIPNVLETTLRNIKQKFIFFTALLPTFCLTASPGYNYHFYLAYDQGDVFFSKYRFLVMFQRTFYMLAEERCTTVTALTIHFVRCNHRKKPAWAQNDAMLEAYVDNIEFYYRINDDTLMRTQNWTTAFIRVLKSFDPPNVGVVGPTHKGGNKKILTYDFVHRTHVDVFGFYYPRVFTDWYGDGWITNIYKPGRSVKLQDVELRHTMKLGQRYGAHYNRRVYRGPELERDKVALRRYIEWSRNREEEGSREKRVIAVTLSSNTPDNTFGAIRNAVLMRMMYPGWIYRVYITQRWPKNSQDTQVADRIINKLYSLGAEVVEMEEKFAEIVPAALWKYLVMDSDADVFLLRDVRHRLGVRDLQAVTAWLGSRRPAAVHCMRDHPAHASEPITDSLWGGIPEKIRTYFQRPVRDMLMAYSTDVREKYHQEPIAIYVEGHDSQVDNSEHEQHIIHGFLSEMMYPAIKGDILCHDSVSCTRWPQSFPFATERNKYDFVGRPIDAFDTLVESLATAPLNVTTSEDCRPGD